MGINAGLFLQHVDSELLQESVELASIRRGIAPPDVVQKHFSREAGRRGLLVYNAFTEFVQALRPDMMEHAYVRRQVNVAQKVIDGRLRNVLVLIPTQYGKSTVWSQLLPAYYLLKYGARRVALSSYGAELAWEHSGEARDLYAESGGQFKEGNPKGATRNWRTARSQGARGGMWATGIGGPSLGRGYHLGITDDPIDPLQVSSTAFQTRFRKWWPAKWLRGQRPNAAKVFVMQRLGLDDPVAWLLEREEDPDVAEHWHIVAFDELRSGEPFGRWSGPNGFPKTCTVEPDPRPIGHVLAPKFRPHAHVLHMQATAGPIVASAQRQQRPMMASGDFWPLGAFADRVYDVLPPDAIDGGWDWDTAYTDNEENSASAGIKSYRSAGERSTCKVYIDDVWWDWLKFPDLVKRMLGLSGPHYVEAKASGKSLVQVLAGYSVAASEVKVIGGKLERAAAAQPTPLAGRVYIRRIAYQKLLYGEGQGLLRVTAEALRDEKSAGLDVNDAFVQSIWRHLDLASKRKRAIAR